MMKTKLIVGLALLVLVGGICVGVYSFVSTQEPPKKVHVINPKQNRDKTNNDQGKRKGKGRKIKAEDGRLIQPGTNTIARIVLPADEEAKLSDVYKKLLAELRAAVEPLDREKIRSLVQRMQRSDEWPDGIPSILHEAAIDALGELGAGGAAELTGYLGSGDADIREAAMDAIAEAVDDDALSDREKSELVKTYAKCLTDEDVLDSLYDIIDNDMRNSVQVETMLDILDHGTPEAKKRLLEETIPEIIDYDDSASLTVDQAKEALNEWAANNPDEEDDDETFKGEPDEDDDETDEG